MTLRDSTSAIVYTTSTDFADNDNLTGCTDVNAQQLDTGNLQIH